MTQIIKYEQVNVRVSNMADDSRTYDIMATVNNLTTGSKVAGIEGGQVQKDGLMKAYFNAYSDGMLTVNYQAASTADERTAVLTAINDFVAEVKVHVSIEQATTSLTEA